MVLEGGSGGVDIDSGDNGRSGGVRMAVEAIFIMEGWCW